MPREVKVEIALPAVVAVLGMREEDRLPDPRMVKLEITVTVDDGLSEEEVPRTARAKAVVRLRRALMRLIEEDGPSSSKKEHVVDWERRRRS